MRVSVAMPKVLLADNKTANLLRNDALRVSRYYLGESHGFFTSDENWVVFTSIVDIGWYTAIYRRRFDNTMATITFAWSIGTYDFAPDVISMAEYLFFNTPSRDLDISEHSLSPRLE